jgi:predicted MFS family arabinose efflux permease
MSMLYGVVFFSHQVGSFLGAWLGGRVFDATGSYDPIWWASVALGIAAALLHAPIADKPLARAPAPA